MCSANKECPREFASLVTRVTQMLKKGIISSKNPVFGRETSEFRQNGIIILRAAEKSAAFVLDIYAHVSPKMQKDAVEKVSGFLQRSVAG